MFSRTLSYGDQRQGSRCRGASVSAVPCIFSFHTQHKRSLHPCFKRSKQPDHSTHFDVGHVRQEALGHRHQSLRGPAMEPVKHGAVDERRELAGTDAELVTHRPARDEKLQRWALMQRQAQHGTCLQPHAKQTLADAQPPNMEGDKCGYMQGAPCTHEKQSTMCRKRRTLLMKKSHRFSIVSRIPAALHSLRTALEKASLSSAVNRSAM